MIKMPSLGFDDVHDNDGELELCNRLKAARRSGIVPNRAGSPGGRFAADHLVHRNGPVLPYSQAGARAMHRAGQEVRGLVLL